MKLIQLLEDVQQLHESNEKYEVFKIAARSLTILLTQINSELAEAVQWRDSTRIMPVMRPLYKWFDDNYTTTRGYSLHTAFQDLKRNAPKYQAIVDAILQIPTVQRDSNKFAGQESKVLILGQVLSDLVDRMFQDTKTSSALRSAVGVTKEYATRVRQFRSDIGIDVKSNKPTITDKGPNINSQQNQKVEEIVNSVLKTLPEKLAGIIRQSISKSDNKLAALSIEMKKHGLA